MKRLCAAMLLLSIVLMSVPALADTPEKTTSGATFTLPTEWSMQSHGPVTVVTAPEGDTHIAIVDVELARRRASGRTGMAPVRPSMHRPLQISTPGAPRAGWDEIQNFAYLTSPNEHMAVEATAMRTGHAWTVAIIEGSDATLDKRSAAVGLVGSSLSAAGYQRETFAVAPRTALRRSASRRRIVPANGNETTRRAGRRRSAHRPRQSGVRRRLGRA